VFVDGEAQLKTAMSASLEEWRIFLHPSQRKVVQWDVQGPMKLNGAAGTGKTVVLMHRAVHLATRPGAERRRILVTTYTPNLAVTIKRLIARLAEPHGQDVAERIEVTNLNALARTICLRAGWKGRIAEPKTLAERISSTPLSRAGIDVRGRSRRLKINYRTTEQIRRKAQEALAKDFVDDLEASGRSTLATSRCFGGVSQKCAPRPPGKKPMPW